MTDVANAPIPGDILEALAANDLPTSQFRILMVVFLATYGKGKETASMASVGISAVTGMGASAVSRAISDLRKRRILLVRDNPAGLRPGIYRINPDVEKWLSRADMLPEVVRAQDLGMDIIPPSVADNGIPFKRSDHKILIENWYDVFYQATKQHYPFRGGKDGRILKDVLQTYGLEMSQRLMLGLYNDWQDGDQFLQDAGISLGIFRLRIPQMLSKAAVQEMESSQTEVRLARFAEARQRARSGI